MSLRRLVLFAFLGLPLSLHAQSLQVDETATRFSFVGDHFQLTLPVQNAGAPVTDTVRAELLGTDDKTRSQAMAACNLTQGRTMCRIDLPPATKSGLPGDQESDLPLLRVRYSVGAASGTFALDQIAPELYVVHLAGAKGIRAGGTYTVQIRTTHPLTHVPRAGVALAATLTASYVGADKQDEDFSRQQVVTDAGGFASLTFMAPDTRDLESVSVSFDGVLANLHLGTELTMSVPGSNRFELTTDKPLYQPGQTVHTRMLVLDRNGHAVAGQHMQVDVMDPDYTLVFRAEAATSAYGIATLDWPVPARMRLGGYNLQAKTLGQDQEQTASAQVRVSRYDLPTFTVTGKPDKPFYLPGMNAVVDVQADYLFGKPVLHGHVRVVREQNREWNFAKQTWDVKEGKPIAGELDGKGHFHAHLDLTADEKYLRSQVGSNRYTDLHLAAYVTDASSGRTEQRRFDVRVAAQALHLYVLTGARVQGLGQDECVLAI